MSEAFERRLTCPHCGKPYTFTAWRMLDAQESPDAYRKLLDGDLFSANCPHCGNERNVIYSMLLHDEEHKALIYLAPHMEDVKAALADLAHTRMPGYRIRIVQKEMELIEKAMIFRAGMDDRIIELIKDIRRDRFRQEFGVLSEIYFLITPDDPSEKRFLFFGPPQKSSSLPDEMYERGVVEFLPYCDDTLEGCLFVDRDWVTRFLEKNAALFGPGGERKVSKIFS